MVMTGRKRVNFVSKHKPTNKDKGGQLVIRVDKADRAAFIAQCEALDTTAAREIRRFMREFLAAKATPATTDTQSPATGSRVADAEVAAAPEMSMQSTLAEKVVSEPGVAADIAAKPKQTRKPAAKPADNLTTAGT